MAAEAQEKFANNARLHENGWLSSDGKFFYTFDFENKKTMKWNLYRGKPEWINWSDYVAAEGYYEDIEIDDTYEFMNAVDKERGYLITLEKKSKKISKFSLESKEKIGSVAKVYVPKEEAASCSIGVTYITYRADKNTNKVIDALTGKEVFEVPYFSPDGKKNDCQYIGGSWYFWYERLSDTIKPHLYNLEAKKEHSGKILDLLDGYPFASISYLPKSGMLMIRKDKRNYLYDTKSDELEEFEVPEYFNMAMARVTADDKLVYYEGFDQYDGQKEYFKGYIACFDPIREFLLSEDILVEGKTLLDFKAYLAVIEARQNETEVDEAHEESLRKWKEEHKYDHIRIQGEGKMYCINYKVEMKSFSITNAVLGCDIAPPNESSAYGTYNTKCFPTPREAQAAYDALSAEYRRGYNMHWLGWEEFFEDDGIWKKFDK